MKIRDLKKDVYDRVSLAIDGLLLEKDMSEEDQPVQDLLQLFDETIASINHCRRMEDPTARRSELRAIREGLPDKISTITAKA